MKRNKNGVLEFDNDQEKNEYFKKKEDFLRRSDEQNATLYTKELIRKYAPKEIDPRFPVTKGQYDIGNFDVTPSPFKSAAKPKIEVAEDPYKVIKEQEKIIALLKAKK